MEDRILVTGAGGYIASWIVKYLLESGRKVNGTVRSLKDAAKVSHLMELREKHPGLLELFEADLLDRESFRRPMEGCSVVIHTASPFVYTKVRDPQNDLVRPAEEGTRNVLTMAGEIPSVRRIVVTSSAAAIYSDAIDIRATAGNIFTEEHWNTASSLTYNAYSYSKTMAEREAWRIAEQQTQWTLATINPTFVLGPSLSKRIDSTSIDTMRSLLNGKFRTGVPDFWFGLVDVRDVAMAHILAATNPAASGRHICSGSSAPLADAGKILKERYPDRPIPGGTVPMPVLYMVGPFIGFPWKFIRRNLGIQLDFDNSRSLQLGLRYHTLSETLIDHAEQLIRDGLV